MKITMKLPSLRIFATDLKAGFIVGNGRWKCNEFLYYRFIRDASTEASPVTDSNLSDQPKDDIKPFSKLPGPKGYPFVGVLPTFRLGRQYSMNDYHRYLIDCYHRYGDIFRVKLNGQTMVHLFSPDYFQLVYKNVGKYPTIVPLLETTQMYRKHRGMALGLGNTNGEEWYRLRSAVQQIMMVPRTVPAFLPMVNSVADEFVERIARIRRQNDGGMVSNLLNEVARWNLESSAMTCFERRLGCLRDDAASDWTQRMLDANTEIFHVSLLMTFSLPLYRLISTRLWRRLITAEDFFFGNGQRLIDETCEEIRRQIAEKRLSDDRFVFLRYLLGREDLDYKGLSIVALSLFADGLSTTTPSLVSVLYCLASNPDKQQLLYNEIKQLAPEPDCPITDEMIQNASYLRACIKEALRLFPIGTDVSRVLEKDLDIGGYHIPAQTPLSINTNLLLREEKYFDDPEVYLPERWLRGGQSQAVHPYLLLPFGHGTRMCAGMRLAEQEMRVMVMKVLQKYRLEWPKELGAMKQTYVMLLKPDRDASIRFIDR